MDTAAAGPITLTTPLGEGALTLRSMNGTEMLGAPFEFELEVITADASVTVTDILGQPVCVSLELPPGGLRYFHGLVSQVSLVDAEHDVATYRVRVNPWLSMLAHRTNCRVFQRKSVVEIAEFLFREHGYSDFEERLADSYPPLEYVVQYRESDLAFVNRLFEQVGIYYYFAHQESKHVLVLADSLAAHEPAPEYEIVPYRPPDAHRDALVEHVRRWQVSERVQSGAVAARDFNFEMSRADLTAQLNSPEEHVLPDGELFDYPGGYTERALGDVVMRRQIEIMAASNQVATADSNARGLLVGGLFSLTEHPVDVVNREYLITVAHYQLAPHDPRAGDVHQEVYSCNFTAMDSSRVYRPARVTPKPVVSGPQTAFVVGKSGEEIWTDEYARVKVQFHWDRYGLSNEDSSCWVRVSQAWAGGGWGAMHIPRIGQEVIVDFLEGDPDRPIITGRVYNNITKVPYTLAANQTQSGIKSRSTKDGNADNFNEIRFEDKKGSEELFIQAEKDQNTKVKHDQSISVANDRAVSVGGNETYSITGTRTTTVTKKDTVTIKDEHEMTVALKVTETFNDDHSLTVVKNQDIKVEQNKTEHVTLAYELTTDQKFNLTQGSTNLTFEGNAVTLDAAGPVKVIRGSAKLSIDQGGVVTLTAPAGITIECGSSKIVLSASGVEVEAMQIALTAKPSSITLTPASAEMSSTIVNVEAKTICNVKGTTMLNLNSG